MKPFLILTALLLSSVNVSARPMVLLPGESRVEFTVTEMGVLVSGTFKRFEAKVDFDAEKPDRSGAELRIETASVDTGNSEADEIARNSDWLDTAHAPHAGFKSTAIRKPGGNRYEAVGTLTIRDRARDIVVRFDSSEPAKDKTVLSGDFTLKRSEFGIGGGVWNEGDVVSDEVVVKVTLALTPQSVGHPAPTH
jgi:polyisoprenoid-binding protein YceI